MLIAFEEGRAFWADLELVQSLRNNYSCKAQAQTVNNSTGDVGNTKFRKGTGSSLPFANTDTGGRICRNHNTGTCTHSNSDSI